MKKLILTLITGLVLFGFSTSKNNVDLKGKWSASCVLNRPDESSITHCALCPITPINSSSIEIDDFSIEINKKELILTILDKTTSVKYKYKNDSLSFSYNDKRFAFKAYTTTNTDVKLLRDSDGVSVVLTKVE